MTPSPVEIANPVATPAPIRRVVRSATPTSEAPSAAARSISSPLTPAVPITRPSTLTAITPRISSYRKRSFNNDSIAWGSSSDPVESIASSETSFSCLSCSTWSQPSWGRRAAASHPTPECPLTRPASRQHRLAELGRRLLGTAELQIRLAEHPECQRIGHALRHRTFEYMRDLFGRLRVLDQANTHRHQVDSIRFAQPNAFARQRRHVRRRHADHLHTVIIRQVRRA